MNLWRALCNVQKRCACRAPLTPRRLLQVCTQLRAQTVVSAPRGRKQRIKIGFSVRGSLRSQRELCGYDMPSATERPLHCPLCTSPCSLLLLLTELHWRCGLTLHFVRCSLPLLTIFTLLLLWCHFSFYCFLTFLLSSCQCFFPFCLPCPSPAESDLSETGRCAHLLPASGSHVWKSYTGKKPAWTDEASWGSLCFLPESVVSYLWGCTHFLFAFSTHVWENGAGKVLVSVEIIFFHTKNKKIKWIKY